MKKNKVSVLFFLSLLLFIIFGCSKSGKKDEDKVILRLATVLPADHPSCQALEFFRNRLGEISSGKIEVQLFLNSQLGKEAETIEMCQAGNIEMLFVSAAPLTQFVPELNALNMPFIYSVVDGQVGK